MPPTWGFNGVAVGPAGTIYVTGDKINVLYSLEPEMTLPETGGVTFPVYTVMLILGGLAVLIGVNLVLHRKQT